MKQINSSTLGKECTNVLYYHLIFNLEKKKLELKLLGETLIISGMSWKRGTCKKSLTKGERKSAEVSRALIIKTSKIMTAPSVNSIQTREEAEVVTGFAFLRLKNSKNGDNSHKIDRCLGQKLLTDVAKIFNCRDNILTTKCTYCDGYGFPHCRI